MSIQTEILLTNVELIFIHTIILIIISFNKYEETTKFGRSPFQKVISWIDNLEEKISTI